MDKYLKISIFHLILGLMGLVYIFSGCATQNHVILKGTCIQDSEYGASIFSMLGYQTRIVPAEDGLHHQAQARIFNHTDEKWEWRWLVRDGVRIVTTGNKHNYNPDFTKAYVK